MELPPGGFQELDNYAAAVEGLFHVNNHDAMRVLCNFISVQATKLPPEETVGMEERKWNLETVLRSSRETSRIDVIGHRGWI